MMFDPFVPDELFVESDFIEVSDFSDFMEFDLGDRIPDLIIDLKKMSARPMYAENNVLTSPIRI